jgi:hypothetical protein
MALVLVQDLYGERAAVEVSCILHSVFCIQYFALSFSPSGFLLLSALKLALQKPLAVLRAAEEPEALAAGGFDAIVVAADRGASPPAGFDPFGTPAADHVKGQVRRLATDGGTVRGDRDDFEGARGLIQQQRPLQRSGG